jgi:CRISPR-associated protein Cmr1
VKIKIRTPLWTGDIDQKSDSLQPSGFLGSLRWWTEVILRGMDKYACDPTGESTRCPKEESDNEKYYCPACLIFGATGMRKTFKLDISGGKGVYEGGLIRIIPSGRKRGWFLGSGLIGDIDLRIIPLDRDFDESLVLLPLILAARWGGIGAKTQHGYGVIEIKDHPEVDYDKFKKAVEKITGEERLKRLEGPSGLNISLRNEDTNGLPNLKEMFFAKIQFEVTDDEWWKEVDGIAQMLQYKNYINDRRMIKRIMEWKKSGSVPTVPAIKSWLRYDDGRKLWGTGNQNQNRRIENWLFGSTKRVCSYCYEEVRGDKSTPQRFWCPNCNKFLKKEETFERISSKINISCAYLVKDNLWEFRIWGWIPRSQLPGGFERDKFLNELKKALNGSGSTTVPWTKLLGNKTRDYKLKTWREFDSSRDTEGQEGNIDNYIQSLLGGEEK